MNWYLKCLNQYADFNGRARRKEYWMFALFNALISIVVEGIGYVIGLDFLGSLYALAVFIPMIAVSVRRLHDIGKSGWWYLILLVPIAGPIIMLIWACKDSQPETNQWGPCPKN